MEFYPAPYGNGPQAKLSFLKQPILKAMEKWPDANIFPNERLKKYMMQYLPELKNDIIVPHIAKKLDLPEYFSTLDIHCQSWEEIYVLLRFWSFPHSTSHHAHAPADDPREFCASQNPDR